MWMSEIGARDVSVVRACEFQIALFLFGYLKQLILIKVEL